MKTIGIGALLVVFLAFKFSYAERTCPDCFRFVEGQEFLYDYTEPDNDGDGMNDEQETQFAVTFKPLLLLKSPPVRQCDYENDYYYHNMPWGIDPTAIPDAGGELDISGCASCEYSYPGGECIPNYNCVTQYCSGPPDYTLDQDGTVYYHVRPRSVQSDGVAAYLEIDYWFYHAHNEPDCSLWDIAVHSHDWEHVSLMVVGDGVVVPYHVDHVFYSVHETGYHMQERSVWGWADGADEQQRYHGGSNQSGPVIFVAPGSFANYPYPALSDFYWDGVYDSNGHPGYCAAHRDIWPFGRICICWEYPDGTNAFEPSESQLYPLGEA